MRPLLKLAGFGLVGVSIAMLVRLLVDHINISPYFWQGLLADVATLLLIAGLVMLVAVPFASLRQTGAAILILGIAFSTVNGAQIFTLAILWRIGAITIGLVGGYLLILKSATSKS
jgi:hypothetical protein